MNQLSSNIVNNSSDQVDNILTEIDSNLRELILAVKYNAQNHVIQKLSRSIITDAGKIAYIHRERASNVE